MKLFILILTGTVGVAILISVLHLVYFPLDISFYLAGSENAFHRVFNSLLADPFFQFEPWRFYAKTRLLSGQIPFWNPYNGGGEPFLANPQTAIFYPLNFLYYLLPISLSLNLIPLIKIFLMGFFSFLFFRELKISKLVSLIAGTLVPFASFTVLWVLWPHTNVFILLPLILYLTEKIYQKDKVRIYIHLLAVCYFVGVLGGHPETLFHIALVHFIYSFFRFGFSKKLLYVALSIILGFSLASFMLLPFFEYVLTSTLIKGRITSNNEYFLPLAGVVYNIFPFFLGLPNSSFYKSIASTTNFQELTGGWIAPVAISIILLSSKNLFKNYFFRFFTFSILVLYCITYKVWPIYIISKLPLVSSLANYRLIGIAGFFLVCLFAISLDYFNSTKSILISNFIKKMYIFVIFFFPALLISLEIALLILIPERRDFILFVTALIFLYFSTTALSVYLYIKLLKSARQKYALTLVFVTVLVQSLIPLFFYNSLAPVSLYYPKLKLTEILDGQHNTKVLQVGNLYFPPETNLISKIHNAQTDDAIGIFSYQRYFNESFNKRNFKKIIDFVSIDKLKEFGITHVISDYDLNSRLENINSGSDKVIRLDKPQTIRIKEMGGTLTQIRIVTANYNRPSNCVFTYSISKPGKTIFENSISCGLVKDNEFMSLKIPDVTLLRQEEYEIFFSTKYYDKNQTIGLRGGENPYIDLILKDNKGFVKVSNARNVAVWAVPGSRLIEGAENIEIIKNLPENFTFNVENSKTGIIEVKKTKYPGWNVKVDGRRVRLLGDKWSFRFSVSEGKHFIELYYAPYSFYLGLTVTILTFLALSISFIRGLHLNFKKLRQLLLKINNARLLIIICIGFLSSAFFYIALSPFIKLGSTQTGGINWYSINNYSRLTDQMRFVLAGFLFIGITIALFFVYLWKVLKK